MANLACLCRDTLSVVPPDVWRTVLGYLRPVTPWCLCRWGFLGLPDRASLLVFDFYNPLTRTEAARATRNLNGHFVTGRYPEDFFFPDPLAEVIVVERAWWIHLLPITDDNFTSFYSWLVDGFPVWIGGRVHRQGDPVDAPRARHRTVREEDADTLPWEEGTTDEAGVIHYTI